MYFIPNEPEIRTVSRINQPNFGTNLNGGITLAYRPIIHRNFQENKWEFTSLSVGYAYCHVGDPFNRKIGKTMAIGRCISSPSVFTMDNFKYIVAKMYEQNIYDWRHVDSFMPIHISMVIKTMLYFGGLLRAKKPVSWF